MALGWLFLDQFEDRPWIPSEFASYPAAIPTAACTATALAPCPDGCNPRTQYLWNKRACDSQSLQILKALVALVLTSSRNLPAMSSALWTAGRPYLSCTSPGALSGSIFIYHNVCVYLFLSRLRVGPNNIFPIYLDTCSVPN